MDRRVGIIVALLYIYRVAVAGSGEFGATEANKAPAPTKGPDGMVWVPGG